MVALADISKVADISKPTMALFANITAADF